MQQNLRRPALILALALIVIAVLVELGAAAFLETAPDPPEMSRRLAQSDALAQLDADSRRQAIDAVRNQAASDDGPPGIGIPYLALVDGVLAYTLALITLALIAPQRLQSKVQGIVSLILSLLLLIGGIVLVLMAIAKLILMVTLLFAPPFGTIAYFALFGGFNTTAAAIVLSLLMLLKLVSAGALIVAQQRFLENKGLVLLVLTSLVATIIVSFLHGLVPSPLVSITDALAAIVVGVLGVVWALSVLIGSISSVFAAFRTT